MIGNVKARTVRSAGTAQRTGSASMPCMHMDMPIKFAGCAMHRNIESLKKGMEFKL